MSVDTPANYIQSMQVHLIDTIPTTRDEYERCEKLLNAHMKSWSQILKFTQRVSYNFQASNNEIPPLYGLRKDHKAIPPGSEEVGPPQRPVCGAVVSCNYRISHFISSIIRPIIEQAPEPCNSTDDLLSRIHEVNESEDLTGCIIGSMDVEALYPSIDINFSVEKCVELIYESGVQFKNADINELGLYLALCMEPAELIAKEIAQFCPTRKKKGKKPTITASGTETNEQKRWSCWNRSQNKPNEDEQRKMVTAALGVAMKTTLKNHIFTFNGEVRKQKNGGAIGVKAAGDIAGLFMIWWDRTFLRRVQEEGLSMKMYTRYVDDETIVAKSIDGGDGNPDERTMTKM